MLSDLEIERILEAFVYAQNRVQKDDHKYFGYINKMKKANLADMSSADMDTVRDFLLKFGGMGRAGVKDDIPRAQSTIHGYADFLQCARGRQLHQGNLASYHNHVIKVFGALRDVVGPVSAAKTLHLICPEFFPLWDSSIIALCNSSCKAKHRCLLIEIIKVESDKDPQKKRAVITGKGYYSFMEFTDRFIHKYYQHLCQIQSVLNSSKPPDEQKGLLKIVDEFNMHATHAPFYYLM